MKEINPQVAPTGRQKYLALVAVLSALGLGIAYANKARQHSEIQAALVAAQTDLDKFAAREKILKGEIAEARTKAQSSGAEVNKAREDIQSLNQKLAQTQEQASAKIQKLEATIASLSSDLAASSERDKKLAMAIPTVDLKAIEGPKPVQTVATKNPTKETAEARNRELLKKFVRISDDFERPKVYMHGRFASLRKDKTTQEPIARLCQVTVTSEGATNAFPFKSIQLLVNDDVVTFMDFDSLHQFVRDPKFREDIIKCRLVWEEHEMDRFSRTLFQKRKTADATLDSEDFVTSLKETYELADSFKELKGLK